MTENKLVQKLKPKKANTQKETHVIFILDDSGSMCHGYDQTVQTFNDQIEIVKKNQADGGVTRVSFYTFGNEVKTLFRQEPASEIKPIGPHNYKPAGGTALYDAIGVALKDAMEADKPNKDIAFLVSVFTDGEENSSMHYRGEYLGAQVRKLQEKGNWTFTLMGPNKGLSQLSDILGIRKDNVAGFEPTSISSRMEARVKEFNKMTSYFSARSVGASSVANLYDPGNME